jgi:hypothetical protein
LSRQTRWITRVPVLAALILVGCSSGPSDGAQPPGPPVSTRPTVAAAEGRDGTAAGTSVAPGAGGATPKSDVATVVRELSLGRDEARCLRVREREVAERPDKDLRAEGYGCRRSVALLPSIDAGLEGGRRLSTEERACVEATVFDLSSEQLDRITSAALNPAAEDRAAGEQTFRDLLKGCGR